MFWCLLKPPTLSTLMHINRVGARRTALQSTGKVAILRQAGIALIGGIGSNHGATKATRNFDSRKRLHDGSGEKGLGGACGVLRVVFVVRCLT